MANALYETGRAAFLGADVDWLADNIKATLIDEADDTIDLTNDDFYNDRASAARVATSGNMGSKTAAGGVADCADFSWTAVTGDQSESVDFWKDTGVESTSQMICNIDTATGLPVTPGGGDITFTVDSGANKLFKL